MKSLKSVTVSKKIYVVIEVVVITILCGLISIWFYFSNYSKRYNKPAFETSYTEGEVNVDKKYGYAEMKVSEEYVVGACGVPRADSNSLDLYFSNPKGNEVLLKCVLSTPEGDVVGETGLIQPNCYIKTVYFNSPQSKGTHNLTIKVLGFEPETYYSKGVVSLMTTIDIEE